MTARGPGSYGLGAGPQFGSPAPAEDASTLESIRKQTSKIEDFLDSMSGPIKPYVFWCPWRRYGGSRSALISRTPLLTLSCCSYLPAIGRFLIVSTFLEDSVRIPTQWSDQLLYLHDYRGSM